MIMAYARRMQRVQPSAIRELLRLGADPEVISFGGGYPDPALFPVAELGEVFAELLVPERAESLQYTASVGLPLLREQVAQRLSRDGIACTAEDVLIIHGGQQGLDLAARMMIDPGDVVITENPTFLGALIAFNPYEPRYATVFSDDDGMATDDLERVLATEPGDHLPTLKSLDTEGRVLHLGSFSKILAPGMRLGWAVAEPGILERLSLLKLAADTQSSTLNMAATSAYLARFDLDAHIARSVPVYRHKRDLMLRTMVETFPDGVSWTEPDGGLFTWLTFPQGFDAAAFMAEQLLPRAKVAFVPGATFFPVQQQPQHARVSFSGVPDERLVRGVTAIGTLLRQV
jgi:2-aminoadipate transaminase